MILYRLRWPAISKSAKRLDGLLDQWAPAVPPKIQPARATPRSDFTSIHIHALVTSLGYTSLGYTGLGYTLYIIQVLDIKVLDKKVLDIHILDTIPWIPQKHWTLLSRIQLYISSLGYNDTRLNTLYQTNPTERLTFECRTTSTRAWKYDVMLYTVSYIFTQFTSLHHCA